MRYFSVIFITFATAKAGKRAHQGMTPAHSVSFFPFSKELGFFDMFSYIAFMCVQFARLGGFSYSILFCIY